MRKFTGVKLMTVTVITVIPRWRTWNQVRIFFVDQIVSIVYFKWHMRWYDSNLWTYHKEITNYDWKMCMKEKIRFWKIAKMTVTENWDDRNCKKKFMISYGHLSDFFKSDFLFHIHFSVVICDFLVKSS
jgi:hypothetical protein